MPPKHLPPGPRLPGPVQAYLLAYRPYDFLRRCRDRHGEAFTVASMLGRVPVFAHPDHVERVFALDGEALLGGAAQSPLLRFAGAGSLMRLDGPEHQAHQVALARAMDPSALPEGGATLLRRIRQAVDGWPVGRPFDLGAALEDLALELVMGEFLGGVPEEVDRAMRQAVGTMRRASSPLGLLVTGLGALTGTWGPFDQIRRVGETYLDRRIAQGEAASGSSRGCIFARLAAGAGKLGRSGLRDETLTLTISMYAALSCALRHAFDLLLREPDAVARLRAATAGAVAAGDPGAVASDPYARAVGQEVVRLRPDIPFAVRRAAVDVTIGPWRLPAGTTLGLAISLLHRRPESFPEPDRFRPERFLEGRPDRFAYIPFGGGKRGCIARRQFLFAQALILASAFARTRYRLLDPRPNPITSLAFVSTPARPLRVVAERIARPAPGSRLGGSPRIADAATVP